jgi:hypothetical protein
MNIVINCIFSHLLFMVTPDIKGNQWVSPAIIAKTAPIEST